MQAMIRSVLDPQVYSEFLNRIRRIRPDDPARWGQMTAPQMLAHLTDQLRHTLGDAPTQPQPGPLRWPVVKQLAMYWVPWPKGRVEGPPEAFLTTPTTWAADLDTFETLLARFMAQDERTDWPDHAKFGRMTRESWGRFCYRHFDYHLRQFGA